MATKIQLAAALDVNVKTIRNHEKEATPLFIMSLAQSILKNRCMPM